MSEELYELLKRRDEAIVRLRRVIESLIHELAEMYAEDEKEKASERAYAVLREVFDEHGLRSDGSVRG